MSDKINLNDSRFLREIVYNELDNSESFNLDSSVELTSDVSSAKKQKLDTPGNKYSLYVQENIYPKSTELTGEQVPVVGVQHDELHLRPRPGPSNKVDLVIPGSDSLHVEPKTNLTKKTLVFPELDFHSSDSSFEPDDTDNDKDYDPALDDETYSSDVSIIRHVNSDNPNHSRHVSPTNPNHSISSPITHPHRVCSTPIPRPRGRNVRPRHRPTNRRSHTFVESETDTSSDSSDDEIPWVEVGPDYVFPEPPTPFLENVGPKHMPSVDSAPIKYFDLFFTTSFLMLIVNETNRYASQYINTAELKDKSRVKEWLPVTMDEIKAFIACILNMGLVRKPTIFSYWSKLSSGSTPWFPQMFPRNRFQLILRFFHLVNNEDFADLPYDPCSKFLPIVEHANRLFRHYFVPHKNLSIDESLIGTKSHTSLMQYMPKKQHHRWGIKLWVLCDSVVNYCLGFYVYRGAASGQEKDEQKLNGLAFTVVKNLLNLGNYLNKGYHVFVDNFYTSVPLAQYLYSVGTYLTGTVRANRKYLPRAIKEKFNVGISKFFSYDNLLLCGFREKKSQKKQVILLSSNSKPTTSEVRRRLRGQAEEQVIEKPDMILEYNKFMGGVDVHDMMLYTYIDERKTLKYYKKVIFNIMSRMVLNAYILYKENIKPVKPMSRVQFTELIVNAIGDEWIDSKKDRDERFLSPNISKNKVLGVKKLEGRKLRLCKVCSVGEMRHRTVYVCVKCSSGVHPDCLDGHKC